MMDEGAETELSRMRILQECFLDVINIRDDGKTFQNILGSDFENFFNHLRRITYEMRDAIYDLGESDMFVETTVRLNEFHETLSSKPIQHAVQQKIKELREETIKGWQAARLYVATGLISYGAVAQINNKIAIVAAALCGICSLICATGSVVDGRIANRIENNREKLREAFDFDLE